MVVDVTTIAEKNGMAIATIRRSNSDTAQPLLVSLNSSDTTEATVPTSVIIGAGESSVTVTIRAVNDSTVDGSQAVNIVASAEGYEGQATVAMTVSDDDRQFPGRTPEWLRMSTTVAR